MSAEEIKSFAKVYGEGATQIVVILEPDDDNKPEITVRFRPKGLGVCKVRVGGFADTDSGWGLAERGFDNTTEQLVRDMVSGLEKEMGL